MRDDEFFVGWQSESPPGVSRFNRGRSWMLVGACLLLSAVLAARQGTIGSARVAAGAAEFRGVLVRDPVPMLVGDAADDVSGASIYYLVNPLKYGLDEGVLVQHHLQHVVLRGSLIYRDDGQAMIEVAPGSVERLGRSVTTSPLGEPEALGEMTLVGEIVDSKCYLGIMNPGILKPHRACAILCIEGGIPPVLLVRGQKGASNYFLLVDEHGAAVNDRVTEYVAQPVRITGDVERIGDRLVLRAPLSSYVLVE